jgi:hypothetical protein
MRPEATPIVDIYHAREHLHDLAGRLTSALGDRHTDWLKARLPSTTTPPATPHLVRESSCRCKCFSEPSAALSSPCCSSAQ